MRFSRAATSENRLVSHGLQQRLKHLGCRDFQDGQCGAHAVALAGALGDQRRGTRRACYQSCSWQASDVSSISLRKTFPDLLAGYCAGGRNTVETSGRKTLLANLPYQIQPSQSDMRSLAVDNHQDWRAAVEPHKISYPQGGLLRLNKTFYGSY